MSGGRTVAFWAVLVTVVLVVAFLAGGPRGDGAPLDPDGTGPLGAKALVETVGALGGRVEVRDGPPLPSDDVAVVLSDDFAEGERARLGRWVEAGGTVVVFDPLSPIAPEIVGQTSLFGSSIPRRTCTIPALDGVGRVDPGGGIALALAPGDRGCFGDDEAALVVVRDRGEGTVVSVGGAFVVTNQALGSFDNAAMAAALIVPRPGAGIAIVQPALPGGGDRTLADLVPVRVEQALIQVGIAFLVYAAWRARRLGRPVVEPQPVEIAGSELVAAVGGLMQQTRSPERAAATLRTGLRRDLVARLGVAPSAPADALVAAAIRAGADPEAAAAALAESPVVDDRGLLALAAAIDTVRTGALSAPRR